MYRVVLVDDEPEFSAWLRLVLDAAEDFHVVGEAATGMEAIRVVESLLPDLVILDMYMPEMDGLEVAKYLHNHLPGVKVILVSAHDGHVYQRLARENGTLAFIPKASLCLDALYQTLQVEG